MRYGIHTLVLSTGSNLGERMKNLESAIVQIKNSLGRISKCSAVYESSSWGYESENLFYNQCLEVVTGHDLKECLDIVQEIERKFGRQPGDAGYHDRSLDIDILFFDQIIWDTELLTVPHPRIPERKFVLVPLAEILPDWGHPALHKTIRELLSECGDTLDVYPVG